MHRESIPIVRHCGDKVCDPNKPCGWCLNGICRSALSAEFYEPEPQPDPDPPVSRTFLRMLVWRASAAAGLLAVLFLAQCAAY